MTDAKSFSHPDLEDLIAHAENRLVGDEAVLMGKHLESCALCRIEIKRYQRFENLGEGSNGDQDQDVQWDRAKLELARAWRDEIHPALNLDGDAGGQGGITDWIRRVPGAWAVPAVAAAVVALVFLLPAGKPDLLPFPDASGEIRGGGELAAPEIELISPKGDLDSFPQKFVWLMPGECPGYTLEIFTSDLKTVHVQDVIGKQFWVPGDELRNKLKPGTVYLWNVQCLKKLQVIAVSGNSWFKLE